MTCHLFVLGTSYVNLRLGPRIQETSWWIISESLQNVSLVAALYILLVAGRISPHASPFLFTIIMLPRRSSTNATPNSTSPPLTSSSVSGRRPLNLVTHQHPFRASTAQTVKTESASESSPREIPPVPPQPVSPFLRSPPSNSRPRRQQTRHDTQETLCPTPFEEYVSPQPPNFMPMPTPSVSQIPELPASPVRSRQPATDGGVGDHFHHNTADYTDRFDSKFSTYPDPGSPHYETAGVSEGVHAGIWATYNKVSQEFDEKRLKKWSEDLDVLLIFVSLVVKGDR